ncbi:MAG: hypothetical protein PVF74_04920 [Anaerolineales bacterium]
MKIEPRLSIHNTLYSALLRFYPAEYRQEFAEEMQEVFSQASADASRSGSLSLVSLLINELLDLPVSALRVHRQIRSTRLVSTPAANPDAPLELSRRELLVVLAVFLLPAMMILAALVEAARGEKLTMQTILYESAISFSMLLAAIPTILVFAAGQWYITRKGYPDRARNWVLIWLVCAILLAIPFALFSARFFTTAPGLVLFLVIPALIGLQALLLIHWREVYSLWREQVMLVSILVIALVLILASTALGDPWLTALLILPALAISAVWGVSTRLGMGSLAIIGVLIALILIVDALGVLGNHFVYTLPWLRTAYTFVSGLGSLLAVLVAALCLKRYLEQPPKGDVKKPVLYLILVVVLVLCVGAVTLRHGVLVRATSRASEDHLPFAVIAAGVIAGLLLALTASGKLRRAGIAFMILIPVVIAFSYTIGLQLEPQAITAARANRLGRAIEDYFGETGEYPTNLGDLTPSHLLIISGPLTGRGQVWCYQSGPGYYRLGYIFFQRYYEYPDDTPFWEPYYEIKVPYAAGQPPVGEWMCDEELRLYKQHGGV